MRNASTRLLEQGIQTEAVTKPAVMWFKFML
jgi:hypothetical protein